MYSRKFRVIPARTFLQSFASDRSHMKKPNGEWIKDPPPYPPIRTAGRLKPLSCKCIIIIVSSWSCNSHFWGSCVLIRSIPGIRRVPILILSDSHLIPIRYDKALGGAGGGERRWEGVVKWYLVFTDLVFEMVIYILDRKILQRISALKFSPSMEIKLILQNFLIW